MAGKRCVRRAKKHRKGQKGRCLKWAGSKKGKRAKRASPNGKRKASAGRAAGKDCKDIQIGCNAARTICKVKVGSEPAKLMTKAKAGAFIKSVKKGIEKRGCKVAVNSASIESLSGWR